MSKSTQELLKSVNFHGRSGGFEILDLINSAIDKNPNLPSIRARIAEYLVDTPEFLRKFDYEVVKDLLKLIGEMIDDDDDAISYLLQRLRQASPVFVGYVSMLLGWFGSKSSAAIPDLTHLVIEGIEGSRQAAEAMTRIGISQKLLVSKLIEQLNQGNVSGFNRLLALAFDSEQQTSDELYATVDAAANSDDTSMRRELAFTLQDLDPQNTIRFRPILERLATDPNENVRQAANQSLGSSTYK